MKNLILASFLILALLGGLTPAQRPKPEPTKPVPAAQTATPYEIPVVVKNLANGLQIIVLPDRSVAACDGGAGRAERLIHRAARAERSLAPLRAHVLLKPNHATAIYRCQMMQFSNSQLFAASGCQGELALKSQIGDVNYQGELEETGSASNGQTQQEVVEYYTSTTSPFLLPVLKSIKDAIRFPKFDEDEFAAEKQVVIGELDRNLSSPYYYINDEMMKRLFYKYPNPPQKARGHARDGRCRYDRPNAAYPVALLRAEQHRPHRHGRCRSADHLHACRPAVWRLEGQRGSFQKVPAR